MRRLGWKMGWRMWNCEEGTAWWLASLCCSYAFNGEDFVSRFVAQSS